ncbi:MAG: glycosidase [Acidimicrobiia bacterium]|nr:glycosidase [Acidimicrobiia bacterium]
MTTDALATRVPPRLRPDPARVIAELFVPGHALGGEGEGRASVVVEHILGLTDEQVTSSLASITERFGGRHRDLGGIFRRHAERIANRLEPSNELSDERLELLGATFTHEYAVEAAALCNPSVVASPDQRGVPAGSLRFVMSTRQIGEGHRSGIGFRRGTFDGNGGVTIEAPGPLTTAGTVRTATLETSAFRRGIRADDAEATGWVLDRLGGLFTVADLEARLSELEAQYDTRRNIAATVRRLRALAARSYDVVFDPDSELGSRVLSPATSVESNGLEDARFVRFVDDSGAATHYATYTAFDGVDICLQLLATADFVTFSSTPLLGAAATNKGLALFPRQIDGRFVALSRHDGARNAIAQSDDLRCWPRAEPLDCPTETWATVQVGNCGSPIETGEGWLVLTHGVGPMRTYSIGALLLDLDDPTRVIRRTKQPLLTPQPDEQNGYVPNVVYSCGALLHGATLLLPYGIGDANIGFATIDLGELLTSMDDASVGVATPL